MQTTNTPDAPVDGERERLPPIGALLKAIGTFGDLNFLQDGEPARCAIANAIAWWEVDFAEFMQKHIELESQISALRDALREIMFMGSSVPTGCDEASFNRGQFYACIRTAAHALDSIPSAASIGEGGLVDAGRDS